jgi:hypothetical protein
MLALTSPTSGGRSVGIVRWRTEAPVVLLVRAKYLWRCMLTELLCFWTLPIVLFLFKMTYNVSETGFCLRLQVELTQLGPIDRTSAYLLTPAPTQDRMYEIGYVK